MRGPAAEMLQGLGHEVSAYGVARVYEDLLDGMVIDTVDAHLAPRLKELGLEVLVTETVMAGEADRLRLAAEVVEFGRSLARTPVGAGS